MFDLFRSRQKAVRYMLIGLLSVVALSMVTYLIPGFGSTGQSSNAEEGTIAEIGNTKLTAQEVVLAMQRIMQSGQLPADMIDVYTPQIVHEMVQQRAIAYEFARARTASDRRRSAGGPGDGEPAVLQRRRSDRQGRVRAEVGGAGHDITRTWWTTCGARGCW